MPTHEEIAVAAYYLWLNYGEQDAVTNWLAAEATLVAKMPSPLHSNDATKSSGFIRMNGLHDKCDLLYTKNRD